MATIRISGSGVNLPTFPGLIDNTGSVGTPGQSGYFTGLTNTVTLGPGEVWMIPPGTWWITPGPYTFLQWLDPVTNTYKVRPCAGNQGYQQMVASDGVNFRLANTTGCPTGAVITTGTATGTVNGIGAAINLLSCVASSGSSTWQTIVGGAIGATIATATTTAGTSVGSGYLYPPIIVIDAPPTGGLQATAIVTSLATGTVIGANIQVINQGAGYQSVPNMNFVNDPRDTVGSGAVYVTTLTATGQLTGLYPINHGSSLTGVPTLSFALTNSANTVSCAATAVMNFTVTAYTTASTTAVGAQIQTGAMVFSGANVITAQTTPVVNPLHASQVTFPRPARIAAAVSGATIITTGQIVEDAGLGIQVVPSAVPVYAATSATGALPPTLGLAVGGTTDTSYIQPV